MSRKIELGEVSNGGEQTILESTPYAITVTLEGVSDILFHRWNCESVAEKAAAAKGSKAKKTDDVESYLYRNEAGEICLPGEYVRQSIIQAARFKQDPRSPRKSAMDLVKAAVVSLTDLASLGTKEYFQDQRRVTVQRAGITRTRPGIKKGWKATVDLLVNLPEYVSRDFLHGLITDAGRLVGLCDFRPSFGRFAIVHFE